MTCPCHDPVVFGHLTCTKWESQPRTPRRVATSWRHTLARLTYEESTLHTSRYTRTSAEPAQAAQIALELLDSARNRVKPPRKP